MNTKNGRFKSERRNIILQMKQEKINNTDKKIRKYQKINIII